MPPASICVGVGLSLWPQAGRLCVSVGQCEDGVQQSADVCTVVSSLLLYTTACYLCPEMTAKTVILFYCDLLILFCILLIST